MCKIFKNSITKKLIIVFLIILLLINIFPNTSQAASLLANVGGVILDAILDFLVFLGDTVLNILQNNFISTEKVVIQAQSDDFESVNIEDILAIVIGVIIIIVSIVVAVASWGSASGASFAGIMAGIKIIGGVIIGTALGGAVAVKGAVGLNDSLKGKFDLPLIRYTPYEIFSNQIPVFDINFISPMETITEKKQDVTSEVETQSLEMLEESYLNYLQRPLRRIEYLVYGDEIEYNYEITEHFINLVGALVYSDEENNRVSQLKELKNSEDYQNVLEEVEKLKNLYFNNIQDDGCYYLGEDIFINNEHNYNSSYFQAGGLNDLIVYIKSYQDAIKANFESEIIEKYGMDYGQIEIDFYTIENFIDITLSDENMETYNSEIEYIEKKYESSASILQDSIATWYKVLRRVALVGLLSVLVYIGIRIIISAPSAQAKYKKIFLNWIVAVCILFVLHYLMVFILTMSTEITKIFLEKSEPNILVELPVNTTIDEKGLPGAYSGGTPTADDPPIWSCSFTGYLRLMAGAYGQENKIGLNNFAYAIMYLIMVVYTCIFTFMYLRRVLYMAFLTMIAPLIALTYPLDKIKDGKAQALGLWLREYMFNALIQPIHLILYVMIISNVMDYVVDHPIFAIVALGFLLPAEKFIRKLFGFEKSDTADDNIANMVGGAAVMSGVSKLSALNKPRTHHEDSGQGNVRTADSATNMEVPQVDTSSQVREAQNNQLSNNRNNRNEIEEAFRNLQAQGVSNEDIRTRLNNQFGDTNLVNEVISSNSPTNINFSDPNLPQGEGRATTQNSQQNATVQNSQQSATPARQLRVPQITPATEHNNDRSFGSRITAGFLNVGYEARKRSIKAKPLKTLGKYTGMAIGGATLGLIGLAAGIATGEFDNTLKFTASGLGIGGNVGGTLGANIGEWTSEQKENFLKGYQGSEEYNNIRFDRKFLASEDLRNMVNDTDIHSEMRGGLASEVHRARAIVKEAQEYHQAGITDSEQIKACMKSGLTAEEGKYAIELAKTMKKGKVNTPKKRADYKAKYKDAFKNQNDSPEKDKKINDIWDTATKIRFK